MYGLKATISCYNQIYGEIFQVLTANWYICQTVLP